MNAVIEEALQVLHNPINIMEVTIEKHYDPNLPTIQGNFSNLGQVLINIINNALQALPDGRGKISLSTSYKQETDSIIVECRDDGIGIPPEIMKDIFKPFFTTKEVGKGQVWVFTFPMKSLKNTKEKSGSAVKLERDDLYH